MAERCWNCGSDKYFQTAAIESCPNCGILCNYHGGGTNEAYDHALAAKHREKQRKEFEEEFERLYGYDAE